MKIEIHREKYINNPCPSIGRGVFDFFWRWLPMFRFQCFVDEIKHLKIVINQACPGMPLHFYVVLNGEHEFHMQSELYDKDEFEWEALGIIGFDEAKKESPFSRKSGVYFYKELIKTLKNENCLF